MAILINDVTPYARYTATAGQTLFTVPFEFFNESDLIVLVNDVTLTYSPTPADETQYSVTGANQEGGGSITLGAPGASLDDDVVIYRAIPIARSANYPETGPMAIASLNTEQAKHIGIMQQLQREADRAVLLPLGEAGFELPAAADRASKVLAFDANGDPLAADAATHLAPLGAFGVTLVANATAADARADLAVNSTAELAAASGASLLGFEQSGTGSLARTIQSKLRDFMSLADKGTTSDALTALQDAETDLATGGRLHIPKASWTLSGTFTADGQRMNIFGDGPNVSNFVFNPVSADVAIEYNNTSAGGMYQGSIEGVGFSSGNSVDKTAIRLINCADITIQRVGIAGGAWPGTGSIGIETKGRQTLRVIECQINCARPIVFGQNATFPTLSTDHYLVDHCELTTSLSTGINIEFENNVMHTNTTLRNLALTGGKYGIYWNATSSPGASYAMNIENVRTEQGADATGYSIYLADSTQTLQTLTIRNVMLDSARNGIYLRRCHRVVMENVFFNQGAGQTALDMTFVAGSRLILINCTKQPSSLMTLTNARCIRRESITSVGFVEEWIYDAGFSSGAIESDVYHGGKPFALNIDAVVPIADNTFTGFVMVSTSEDVSAIYCLRGTNNTTQEISDPNAFFTTTAGSANQYNIYWDAGTSRYVIQSKRPVNANVSVYRIGTTA